MLTRLGPKIPVTSTASNNEGKAISRSTTRINAASMRPP